MLSPLSWSKSEHNLASNRITSEPASKDIVNIIYNKHGIADERRTVGVGCLPAGGFVFVAPEVLPSFGPVEIASGGTTSTVSFPPGDSPLWGCSAWAREVCGPPVGRSSLVTLVLAFSGKVGMCLLLVPGVRSSHLPFVPLASDTLMLGTGGRRPSATSADLVFPRGRSGRRNVRMVRTTFGVVGSATRKEPDLCTT